jgi:hypothetical protein
MVGSIYCVPLFSERKGLRAHNLGAYIVEQEIPRCLTAKSLKGRPVDTLIIELDTSTFLHTEPIGTNYLHMGNVHFESYWSLKKELPRTQQELIEVEVVRQIEEAQVFLKTCDVISRQGKDVSTDQFFRMLTYTVPCLPILGYIYFEALCEYLVLFSQDTRSQQFMVRGELNCWGYKECVFRLRPNLLRNFNLATFGPSIIELSRVLERLEQEEFVRIKFTELLEYVKERIAFLVQTCLFGSGKETISWTSLEWRFEELARVATPLVGHAIDREVRRTEQYKGFHFLFDEHKAKSIWEYWQAMGIAVPFNGILPKGEIGINPACTGIRYKIHRGKSYYIGSELHVEPAEELAIQIPPHLIHPRRSFMGIRG